MSKYVLFFYYFALVNGRGGKHDLAQLAGYTAASSSLVVVVLVDFVVVLLVVAAVILTLAHSYMHARTCG